MDVPSSLLDDLVQSVHFHIDALEQERDSLDVNMDVHFGCTCGCGGDFYEEHPEYWDEQIEADEEINEQIKTLKERLRKLRIYRGEDAQDND